MKYILISLCLLLSACATENITSDRLLYPYEPSVMCQGCHQETYEQYRNSMHSKSFSNPLFNVQYFKEMVPRALKNPKLAADARKCLKCHAPVVYMNFSGLVSTPQQAAKYESGVTCDFCHTLAGHTENGDYVQNPSGKKQGPLTSVSDLFNPANSQHAEYSGYLPMAEFCESCHSATNHLGMGVESTFNEWSKSRYGQNDDTCQGCHMNRNGYLKKGVAEYDSGVAAHMSIGNTDIEQKIHKRLHNHSFPGGHSSNQLEGALVVQFRVGSRSPDVQGRFPFRIHINNERSGHKIPSGSSALRFMWVTVTAMADNGTMFPVLLLNSKRNGATDYAVAGASPDDTAILGNDVPPGARIYRSVLVDAKGRQSLFYPDATRHVFDNRLKATEIRNEGYELQVPPNYSGQITLSATISYRIAPSSFATNAQVADFKPVVIASQQKKISFGLYAELSESSEILVSGVRW